MQRHLQLTIVEPLEPNDKRIQIESAVIDIDLHTGHVTLPGGFVCKLQSLAQVVYMMEVEQWLWVNKRRYLKDRRL